VKSLFLLVSALYLTSPLWTGRFRPDQYRGGRSSDLQGVTQRNSSALARLLGEYRAVSSDVLMVKTEQYLHSGVGYDLHVVNNPAELSLSASIADLASHQREVAAQAAPHAHAGGVRTHIPPPQADHRGFLGDWLRAVKPWRDPALGHQHTDGREILPWYRVMTLNNPHYVRAYAMGAWWLLQEDIDQAERFIREGVRHNPESFLVHMMLAQIQLEAARRANQGPVHQPRPETLPLFREAAAAYRHAAELAFAERPRDMENLPDFSPWKYILDDDARRTMEMAVITTREYDDAGLARDLARRYAPLYPRSGPLQRAAAP
jgi:hypothetical protein